MEKKEIRCIDCGAAPAGRGTLANMDLGPKGRAIFALCADCVAKYPTSAAISARFNAERDKARDDSK